MDKHDKIIQKNYIDPIAGTCQLFLWRLREIKGMGMKKPLRTRVENLYDNLEHLIKTYKEDTSCH